MGSMDGDYIGAAPVVLVALRTLPLLRRLLCVLEILVIVDMSRVIMAHRAARCQLDMRRSLC